jgi:hypothetical protein
MHNDSDSENEGIERRPIGCQTPRFKTLVRYLSEPKLVAKEVESIMRITTKFLQSERARRPRKPRRNRKLEKYVASEEKKNRTAAQIAVRLQAKTGADLRRLIGRSKAPSERTIGRYCANKKTRHLAG